MCRRTAPRPYDPMVGRDKSKVVNDEIVEFRKADDPMDVAKTANEEPEVLDRQMRVSRNVEEHELENALRSLPHCKCPISRIQRLQHPVDTTCSLLDTNAS